MRIWKLFLFAILLNNCSSRNPLINLYMYRSSVEKILIEEMDNKGKTHEIRIDDKQEVAHFFQVVRKAKGKEMWVIVPKYQITFFNNRGSQVIIYAGDDWFGPETGSTTIAIRYFLPWPYFKNLYMSKQ
ncbi:MAG: hypothetical protein H6510_04480 [Acidobacteria bacterium]|nr:hypothetical protein [Acidobacteriota bacterium]